jgi:hypothetical protein
MQQNTACTWTTLIRSKLNPRSTVLFQTLTVTHLVKTQFTEPQGSLPCSQKTLTSPCPTPDNRIHTLLIYLNPF